MFEFIEYLHESGYHMFGITMRDPITCKQHVSKHLFRAVQSSSKHVPDSVLEIRVQGGMVSDTPEHASDKRFTVGLHAELARKCWNESLVADFRDHGPELTGFS
jgi:hypothetical protein